ncbi:hypothetical protein TSMEX_002590 [Taenia solium]|eukprot:TsM_000614800 transcript=TsM_000614800 gene=TsM_000614800
MDAERQIITMNCVPSCHQQGSPLTYACSNTSNNSTSNPSYYSPNATEVNDTQDLHITATPCNNSMQDLTGLSLDHPDGRTKRRTQHVLSVYGRAFPYKTSANDEGSEEK